MKNLFPATWLTLTAFVTLVSAEPVSAQNDPPPESAADALDVERPKRVFLPEPEGARRLSKLDRIWIDPEEKAVLVDGYVSLNRGLLEMFACGVNTKEHESVVALQSEAYLIHTALLAVGAEVGSTATFHPEFKPPTGTTIEILIRYRDQEGQWQAARAQDWVRDLRTKKPMTESWVFAGSGFWTDPETGKRHYMAESGDLICVSNFSTAMLDIPMQSTQSDEGRLFEANSELVPPLGTPVRLVLKPKK